jgi:hypothetical protein
MKGIALYYNPNCPDCIRQAKRTAQFDWIGRVELLTEDSPFGKVPIGEIHVVDKQRKKIFTGIYATRKVCLQVPLFYLYGLALYLSPIRKMVGGKKQGCNGDSCEI